MFWRKPGQVPSEDDINTRDFYKLGLLYSKATPNNHANHYCDVLKLGSKLFVYNYSELKSFVAIICVSM